MVKEDCRNTVGRVRSSISDPAMLGAEKRGARKCISGGWERATGRKIKES